LQLHRERDRRILSNGFLSARRVPVSSGFSSEMDLSRHQYRELGSIARRFSRYFNTWVSVKLLSSEGATKPASIGAGIIRVSPVISGSLISRPEP